MRPRCSFGEMPFTQPRFALDLPWRRLWARVGRCLTHPKLVRPGRSNIQLFARGLNVNELMRAARNNRNDPHSFRFKALASERAARWILKGVGFLRNLRQPEHVFLDAKAPPAPPHSLFSVGFHHTCAPKLVAHGKLI